MESDANVLMKECWNVAGARYLAVADAEFGWSHLSKPYISKHASRFVGARVLDVGCGNGRFADLVVEKARSYLGIDWSPVILEGARLQRPTLEFQVGDAETLEGIADNAFDAAVALNVLQNHARADLALKRIASTLVENGTLLVIIEHPMRTSAIRRASPPDQVAAYKALGVERAYDAIFTYRSAFLGEDTPIIGWHRPLSVYWTMLKEAGFCIEVFDELALPPDIDPPLAEQAVKRGMIGEPVFAAIVARKVA